MATSDPLAYTFAVSGVINPDAFYNTMLQSFSLLDSTRNFYFTADADPNVIDGATMYTTSPIPAELLPTLQALVTNYVEPKYFFPGFSHCETYPINSDVCISTTPKVMYSFIFPGRSSLIHSGKSGLSVVDKIKLLIEITIPTLGDATALAGGSHTLTLEVYDITREVHVMTTVADLQPAINDWIAEGEATPATKYTCTLFTSVYNKNSDYDCIWQVRGSLSDASISARLQTMQFVCMNAPQGVDGLPYVWFA